MFTGTSRVLLLAAFGFTAGFAQDQNVPPTVRDYCIKVAPGKTTEFENYVREVAVPLGRARAESGEFATLLLLRGVVPAGSAARCDYRVVYVYDGLPPEPVSNEQIEAASKKAGLNMTAADLIAKRDSLTQLVDLGIWYQIDRVGPRAQKGNYLRLNHYNVKPGASDDWQKLETTYWKPMVEAWREGGGKGAWGVYGLAMPEGEVQPYNAGTVDVYPDWNSAVRGIPMGDLWKKVHPQADLNDFFLRLDKVRTRHDVELFKVVEAVSAR